MPSARSLPGAGGARLASSRLLAQRFGWSADAAASGPVGSDVLYETALRVTLQVIVPAD
jgi:hypothetical protein